MRKVKNKIACLKFKIALQNLLDQHDFNKLTNIRLLNTVAAGSAFRARYLSMNKEVEVKRTKKELITDLRTFQRFKHKNVRKRKI